MHTSPGRRAATVVALLSALVATLLGVPTVSAQATTPPPAEFFGTW